mgnify:CR=1 FL=1
MSAILSVLLAEGEQQSTNDWLSYVLIGVLVVVLIGAMVLMNRRNKKRQQEAEDLINAVKPGNKVKTIGGVCGIVVEVDEEENTFVLETGSETSGKCYMKFDRQAILQSDAVVEKAQPADKKDDKKEKEEQPAEEKTEEAPAAEEDKPQQ